MEELESGKIMDDLGLEEYLYIIAYEYIDTRLGRKLNEMLEEDREEIE